MTKKLMEVFSVLLFSVLLIPNQQLYAQSNRGMTIVPRDSSNLQIQGNYWALVIGINRYIDLPAEKQLDAARPDAQAVAELLKKKYGFKVVELYDGDATRKKIYSTLRTFAKTLAENDNLLIYFAGHGEYDKDTSMGGWLPSDAKPNETDTYISNEEIRGFLKNIKAKHIFTIADSCFSQALMGTKTRSLRESSVKELYNDRSRWVLTAGGLYPVPDKGKGDHSIFAYYLIKILEKNREKFLPADKLSSDLRDAVSNETTQQTPRSAPIVEAGDEGGQFIFVYASATPPAIEAGGANHLIKEEQEKLREEKANLEEAVRTFKEKVKQAEKEIEQEKSSRLSEKVQMEKEIEQEKRHKLRILDEKVQIEREKREIQKQKNRPESIFVPPAF